MSLDAGLVRPDGSTCARNAIDGLDKHFEVLQIPTARAALNWATIFHLARTGRASLSQSD